MSELGIGKDRNVNHTGSGGRTITLVDNTGIVNDEFPADSGIRSIKLLLRIQEITSCFCADATLVEAFLVEPDNECLRSADGVLFDRTGTRLLRFPPNKADSYVIPDGVTHVDQYAFRNNPRLRSVTLSSSVTSIGESAFVDCPVLEHVEIPPSVTSIGDQAFFNCPALKVLEIPPSVEQIGICVVSPWTRLRIEDVYRLPAPLRPAAAAEFARAGGGPDSPGYARYRAYLKRNNPSVLAKAMREPALLELMCRERLITPGNTERYAAAAKETGNPEAITLLMDYQVNQLTRSQKEELRKRRERAEEKRMERRLFRRSQAGIAGLKFARVGHLDTFDHPEDLKAFILSRGGSMVSAVSSRVDYLIVNERAYYPEDVKKAETMDVDVISEREFNVLAGRAYVMDGTTVEDYYGPGGDVTVPAGVTVIGTAAFLWTPELVRVVLPDTVTAIRINAFAYSRTLREITIPASVKSIDDTAFCHSENVTIRGETGSVAESYARERGIPFEAL